MDEGYVYVIEERFPWGGEGNHVVAVVTDYFDACQIAPRNYECEPSGWIEVYQWEIGVLASPHNPVEMPF